MRMSRHCPMVQTKLKECHELGLRCLDVVSDDSEGG